jgi:hypothetical protein
MPNVLDRDLDTITQIGTDSSGDSLIAIFMILSVIAMVGFMIYAFNHDGARITPHMNAQQMSLPLAPPQLPAPNPDNKLFNN